jgi:molybdopterin-dependent oxidoreductase alpha subunit
MQQGIRPEFFARYGFPELRALTPRQLETSGRLVFPLYAGPNDTHYSPITWEQAFDLLVERLAASGPARSFFYASGRSSMEAGFLLQLFARVFGTNYVNNCSYYCHQASGVGLTSAIGTGTGTVQLSDLEQCDLYILIGANPASNHPRLMRSLMDLRRRGGDVIVVNPARELGLVNFRVPSDWRSLLFGSEIATSYLQPHIGGDIALLTGVAKDLLAREACDRRFIETATEDFSQFVAQVEATSWDEIVEQSGVPFPEIKQFADRYLAAKNVIFGWTMGITHHLHGTDNVRMIANLALLRGMVGRPGAGLMPIRGHSNVQGMGSVGVTPVLKQAILQRFEQNLGITVPRSPGLDTMACMDAADRGEMQAALCLGGNLYGSNPDAVMAERALGKIGLVAYLTTTLNTGHAWGRGQETLVLPVLPRDEEPQPTTQESMFSFVRLSDGGPARYPGPRSEVSILAELGRRVLPPHPALDWQRLQSHEAIRQLIATTIPGLESIGRIGESKEEFSIPGRYLDQPRFPTPSGKARFQAVALPRPEPLGPRQLRMMTIRSEGQFNTVVYDDDDLYRGQERRDVILMHPTEITRLGLVPDQAVRVRSAVGELRYQRVRPFDVRPGNAMMYCPESNGLIPRAVDPESKTPAFKHIVVEIEPE